MSKSYTSDTPMASCDLNFE